MITTVWSVHTDGISSVSKSRWFLWSGSILLVMLANRQKQFGRARPARRRMPQEAVCTQRAACSTHTGVQLFERKALNVFLASSRMSFCSQDRSIFTLSVSSVVFVEQLIKSNTKFGNQCVWLAFRVPLINYRALVIVTLRHGRTGSS